MLSKQYLYTNIKKALAFSFLLLTATLVTVSTVNVSASGFVASDFGETLPSLSNGVIANNSVVTLQGKTEPGWNVNKFSGYIDVRVAGNPNFSTCDVRGRNYSCDLLTGNISGVLSIQVRTPGNGWQDTGKKIALGSVAPVVADTTDIINANLSDLGRYLNCGSKRVRVSSTINCSGVLPSTFVLANKPLSVSFQTTGGNQFACSVVGPLQKNVNCNNVFVGSTRGRRQLQGINGYMAPLAGQLFTVY